MINFKKKNLKIKAPENRNMKARSRVEIDVACRSKSTLNFIKKVLRKMKKQDYPLNRN
jgi:hypothetical protein